MNPYVRKSPFHPHWTHDRIMREVRFLDSAQKHNMKFYGNQRTEAELEQNAPHVTRVLYRMPPHQSLSPEQVYHIGLFSNGAYPRPSSFFEDKQNAAFIAARTAARRDFLDKEKEIKAQREKDRRMQGTVWAEAANRAKLIRAVKPFESSFNAMIKKKKGASRRKKK